MPIGMVASPRTGFDPHQTGGGGSSDVLVLAGCRAGQTLSHILVREMGAGRAASVGALSLTLALSPGLALANGEELRLVTCAVVLADASRWPWTGGGQGPSSVAAMENAVRDACDGLPRNARPTCRQQARTAKWDVSVRAMGDLRGRARYQGSASVEIYQPRSRVRGVGRAIGLVPQADLQASALYSSACRQAIQQACRLLGSERAQDFSEPAGVSNSRPCVRANWWLAEQTVGRDDEEEGAAFDPVRRPNAETRRLRVKTKGHR